MPKQSKDKFPKQLSELVKDHEITPIGWDYISSLSKVVVMRYYRTYDTEDLISLSIMDLAEFLLILENGENPRNLRNVLFTRSRNTVSNYLYHKKKYVPTDDVELDVNEAEEDLECDIKYEFNSIEQARLLSLEIWRYYEGTRETLKNCESK